MEVTGKIRLIDETKTVGSAGFRKRDLVITTEEQYPQHILIQFVQDKCDILNNFSTGESVKVSVNLRGREWINPQGETVFFNTIQGWKIDKLQPEMPQPIAQTHPSSTQNQNTTPFETASNFKEEEFDDLPF